jgi:hypothetical protein
MLLTVILVSAQARAFSSRKQKNEETFSSISTVAVTITEESSAPVGGDKGRDKQVTTR